MKLTKIDVWIILLVFVITIGASAAWHHRFNILNAALWMGAGITFSLMRWIISDLIRAAAKRYPKNK